MSRPMFCHYTFFTLFRDNTQDFAHRPLDLITVMNLSFIQSYLFPSKTCLRGTASQNKIEHVLFAISKLLTLKNDKKKNKAS